MTMRSPIVAMLWENWRLTRVEAAQRLTLGLVAGSAALVLFDAGATIAFWILILLNALFWFSIARLNGGRFVDGYKPGFPLYLLYTRPVSTAAIVGVAMAYDAITCLAMYLASAALLGFAFGQSLPLFSASLWLVTCHFACTCIQWSTQKRVVQWLGSFAIGWPLYLLLKHRVASPLQVEFAFAENALMFLIVVASFGLTVAGVARQRRGDAVASVPRAAGSGGYPDWLVTLFRFQCPTSSATKAQIWFELKSSGVPVLTIGLGLAMLIFLLFAISIPLAPVRYAAVVVAMFSVPVVLFGLGNNAFGIRRRQGRTYASAFEATQPYGTAQLSSLKVLVRAACVLAALIAIGVSVWTSSSLVGEWGEWMVDGNKDAVPGLLRLQGTIGHAFGGVTWYALTAQAVVAAIAIAGLVAWQAAREAFRVRHPRRLFVAGMLLLVWCLAIILLSLAARNGIASPLLVGAIMRASGWIAVAAMVFTAIYFLRSGFAERVLTTRYVCGAFVTAVMFGAAWVTVLRAAGVQLTAMPGTDVVRIMWPVLLLVLAGVTAPWSLNRIRHM